MIIADRYGGGRRLKAKLDDLHLATDALRHIAEGADDARRIARRAVNSLVSGLPEAGAYEDGV